MSSVCSANLHNVSLKVSYLSYFHPQQMQFNKRLFFPGQRYLKHETKDTHSLSVKYINICLQIRSELVKSNPNIAHVTMPVITSTSLINFCNLVLRSAAHL